MPKVKVVRLQKDVSFVLKTIEERRKDKVARDPNVVLVGHTSSA